MQVRDLGVCSWSLRPSGPEQLVERVRQAGLQAVQLDLTPLADGDPAWIDAGAILADAGVRVLSGMMRPRGEDYASIARIRETGGVRSDALWPQNRHLASRVAEVAARLGVTLITFHGGFIPHGAHDPLRATMISRLRTMIDLCAGAGVQVALETGQESAACLLAALDEIGRPRAGVNFDPANMLLYGAGDPLEALRLLRPWVRQVHAKDAEGSGQVDVWGRETPVGQGAVPWQAFMQEVRALPIPVPVVIEREGGERRVQEVAAARTFLQPML